MSGPIKVLFICTGNCCRSQMAEAILRHVGGDRFAAFSAGSNPAGYVHLLAQEAMERMGISMAGQYSKSWDVYEHEPMDAIITVCDSAASQPCPHWAGHPATAHWGLPDPSFSLGTDDDRMALAVGVACQARRWIEQMVVLPLEKMSPEQLKVELQRIASPA